MKEDSLDDPDPTLSLEKNDLLSEAYYKYAKDCGHSPASYWVLKALYERHIEGKQVPFHRHVITPEEPEEIEGDKKLPPYSRAFAQDARRSKCINVLNNIRTIGLPVCSKSIKQVCFEWYISCNILMKACKNCEFIKKKINPLRV